MTNITLKKLVDRMTEASISYACLRESNKLLLDDVLAQEKDFDILIPLHQKTRIHRLFRNLGYIEDPRIHNWKYLYNATPFRYYRNLFGGPPVDVCYQLCVKSTLSSKIIVPLHKEIQSFAFDGITLCPHTNCAVLGDCAQFVYESAYFIFNKKGDNKILNKLRKKYYLLSEQEKKLSIKMLTHVFFSFTAKFIELVEDPNGVDVYKQYLQHGDY